VGKFYPQAGSPQNWFCRRRDRVFKYSANIESTIYLFCNKKDFERGGGEGAQLQTTILQIKPSQNRKKLAQIQMRTYSSVTYIEKGVLQNER
jgi:hypothetical protein